MSNIKLLSKLEDELNNNIRHEELIKDVKLINNKKSDIVNSLIFFLSIFVFHSIVFGYNDSWGVFLGGVIVFAAFVNYLTYNLFSYSNKVYCFISYLFAIFVSFFITMFFIGISIDALNQDFGFGFIFNILFIIIISTLGFKEMIKNEKQIKKLELSNKEYGISKLVSQNINIKENDLLISVSNLNNLNNASDFLSEHVDELVEKEGFSCYDEYYIEINSPNVEIENS